MKKILLVAVVATLTMSFAYLSFESNTVEEEINWMSLEEAMEAGKKQKKKVFIDVYTDWCKWCKVMDERTFNQPEVIEYMNKNFYACQVKCGAKRSHFF